jgi:mRNA deadenylase 3'-5' endonuclease subunit Ccr4
MYTLYKMSHVFMKHCKFDHILSLAIENWNFGFLNNFHQKSGNQYLVYTCRYFSVQNRDKQVFKLILLYN